MIFLFTVLFAIAGLALHARRLPLQNLGAIALLIYGGAAILEWSARAVRIPFSPLPLETVSFWSLPVGWIGALLFSRKIAQAVLKSRRQDANYGLWILLITVLVTTGLWSLAEGILADLRPLNMIGRLLASVALLLIIFPWLIEKRPRMASAQ